MRPARWRMIQRSFRRTCHGPAHATHHRRQTAGAARGILSTCHIRRVSGYLAEAIRAVTLRQGARTDLTPAAHVSAPAHALTSARPPRPSTALPTSRPDYVSSSNSSGELTKSVPRHSISSPTSPPLPARIGSTPCSPTRPNTSAPASAAPGPLWTITADRFLRTAWWVSDPSEIPTGQGRLSRARGLPASTPSASRVCAPAGNRTHHARLRRLPRGLE